MYMIMMVYPFNRLYIWIYRYVLPAGLRPRARPSAERLTISGLDSSRSRLVGEALMLDHIIISADHVS